MVRQLHHRWVVGDSTDEGMETVADRLRMVVADADQQLRDIGV